MIGFQFWSAGIIAKAVLFFAAKMDKIAVIRGRASTEERRLKQGWTLQEWTTRKHVAWVDNAKWTKREHVAGLDMAGVDK